MMSLPILRSIQSMVKGLNDLQMRQMHLVQTSLERKLSGIWPDSSETFVKVLKALKLIGTKTYVEVFSYVRSRTY